ncbi:hypothetical protein Peur_054446 [Populus x canadensis]
MEENKILWLALILYMIAAPVYCRYYSQSVPYVSPRKKVSELHFFFHDRISGENPTSVLIARPNITKEDKSPALPFGSLFAVYDPLTAGRFNGSSLSLFSRNPVTEKEREAAVVGGRGKFRMARGFARLKTRFTNETASGTVVECRATVVHH